MRQIVDKCGNKMAGEGDGCSIKQRRDTTPTLKLANHLHRNQRDQLPEYYKGKQVLMTRILQHLGQKMKEDRL